MKKQLVASLAAAMVLGVAGTSFAAANPFSDVPAKHWAYDSVAKLSKAGIVDGYGDGTYKGDKMITRYEMAQVVAKAMARSDKADAAQKAQIDKLATEFAEELNVLGVRVSALEKKVGSVKVTGDARVRWVTAKVNATGGSINAPTNDTKFQERFRLNLTADVNENTSMYARIMMGHTTTGTALANNIFLSDAAFTTKNVFGTGATATAGRFSQSLLGTGYLLGTTGGVDGVKVTAGKNVKVTVGFANFAGATGSVVGGIQDAFFATAQYNTSKVTALHAAYLREQHTEYADFGNAANFDIKGLGVTTKLNKDWAFATDYSQNTSGQAKVNGSTPKMVVVKLNYKGADAKVQGSWGAGVEYFKFDNGSLPNLTDNSTAAMIGIVSGSNGNYKGYALSGSYTLAKNITFEGFQTFNSKTSPIGGAQAIKTANYSRLQVNYMF